MSHCESTAQRRRHLEAGAALREGDDLEVGEDGGAAPGTAVQRARADGGDDRRRSPPSRRDSRRHRWGRSRRCYTRACLSSCTARAQLGRSGRRDARGDSRSPWLCRNCSRARSAGRRKMRLGAASAESAVQRPGLVRGMSFKLVAERRSTRCLHLRAPDVIRYDERSSRRALARPARHSRSRPRPPPLQLRLRPVRRPHRRRRSPRPSPTPGPPIVVWLLNGDRLTGTVASESETLARASSCPFAPRPDPEEHASSAWCARTARKRS